MKQNIERQASTRWCRFRGEHGGDATEPYFYHNAMANKNSGKMLCELGRCQYHPPSWTKRSKALTKIDLRWLVGRP